MAIKDLKTKKTCSCCNRNLEMNRNYFTINLKNDPIFKDGLYPICKDCLKKDLANDLINYKVFVRALMIMNRPFILADFENVGNDYYKYLQYIGRSNKADLDEFLDSDNIFSKNSLDLTEDTVERLTPEELRDCQLYWGVGNYSEDDYVYLLTRYEKYLSIYDVDTPTFEAIVQQLCQLELDIQKKRILGTDTTKESKLMMELMKSAGIAPSQEKESKTNEAQTFGNWVRIWENEQPVPEPLPQFKDPDGIKKYIENNFLSPMRKSLELDDPLEEQYKAHIKENGISKEDLLGIESDK